MEALCTLLCPGDRRGKFLVAGEDSGVRGRKGLGVGAGAFALSFHGQSHLP